MNRKQTVLALAAAFLTVAQPVFSQEYGSSEVSVQVLGSLVTGNTHQGIGHDATNSGGVLSTYRFFVTKYHGVEANYGYARNSLRYTGQGTSLRLRNNNHEVSGAYVFRYPLNKWQPFAVAGVASLIFDPVGAPAIDSETRAAFVYGGGADFNLSRRIFVRAQYRGFVYNSPVHSLEGRPAVPLLDRTTHRAEPSVGFGVRF